MKNEALAQLDAFTTPGTLLRTAREAQGLSERDAADRLKLMPNYVGILERDQYGELRSVPFARGYVKSYGRLLGVDEERLMMLFDELQNDVKGSAPKRIETQPLQLQPTGAGVVVGLVVLLAFVLLLWWSSGSTG